MIRGKRRACFWALFICAAAASGCAEPGILYVSEDVLVGTSIFNLSYGPPRYNAERAENIVAQQVGTAEYGGHSWRMYEIDAGDWDVYIEWTHPEACSDYCNERTSVYIDPGSTSNQWAAVYVYPIGAGGAVRTEQGGGELSLMFLPE